MVVSKELTIITYATWTLPRIGCVPESYLAALALKIRKRESLQIDILASVFKVSSQRQRSKFKSIVDTLPFAELFELAMGLVAGALD
eukprot:5036063-Amphidinium_carterae.1